MSLPQYQIAILSPYTGAVQMIFDVSSVYNLRYSRALNDIGRIAITFPSTPEIRDLFPLDTFIEVYRADINGTLIKEETYLTRLTHRFIEGNEERFVVGGVSLNHLLARRIIDPSADTPGDSHSTKSGAADQVIYDYVNEQAGPGTSIARRTPGLTLTSMPIGRSVSASLRFEYLFNQIQDLARNGAVDFQIVRTTGANLELQIGVIGSDKTYGTNAPYGNPWVGLNPKRGNLTQPSILADRKGEGNYVYCLGQGQGADRLVYQLAGDGVLDSPFNRIEFVADQRQVDKLDTAALASGAQSALQKKVSREEFTYQPTGQEPGNTYNLDWFLGDAVTIEWDEKVSDLRITQVEINLDASGESIDVTVSNDFIFPGSPIPISVDFPIRASLIHPAANVVTGSPIWILLDNTMRHGYYAYLSSHANADVFTQSVMLAAGTYTFTVLGYAGNISGMVDWYLDDVIFITGQDWYAAGGTPNTIKTGTVVISADGYHTLKGVTNGKNGASGGYYLALAKYWFKQAVDK